MNKGRVAVVGVAVALSAIPTPTNYSQLGILRWMDSRAVIHKRLHLHVRILYVCLI